MSGESKKGAVRPDQDHEIWSKLKINLTKFDASKLNKTKLRQYFETIRTYPYTLTTCPVGYIRSVIVNGTIEEQGLGKGTKLNASSDSNQISDWQLHTDSEGNVYFAEDPKPIELLIICYSNKEASENRYTWNLMKRLGELSTRRKEPMDVLMLQGTEPDFRKLY